MRLARRPERNRIKRLFRPSSAVPEERGSDEPEFGSSPADPGPQMQDSALETFGPERGEVFFEEEPKPFALSVREIVDEYRSDSSPDRYAMAVELGEADDWEVYLGPPSEDAGEQYYPSDGRKVQDILHATWDAAQPASYSESDSGSIPYEDPPSTAASGGYAVRTEYDWMDILEEYRTDPDLSGSEENSAPVRRRSSPKRVRPFMKNREEQPDIERLSDEPSETADGFIFPEEETGLPSGIRPLTERRRVPAQPVRTVEHLSVEEILAEYHGYTPAAPADEPVSEQEPEPETAQEALSEVSAAEESVPAEEQGPRRRSRLANMEEEARSLFAGLRRSVLSREKTMLPGDETEETSPAEEIVPEPVPEPDRTESIQPVPEQNEPEFEVTLPMEAQLPLTEAEIAASVEAVAAQTEAETAGQEADAESPSGEEQTPAGENGESTPSASPFLGLKSRFRGLGRREKKEKPEVQDASDTPLRESAESVQDEEVSPAAYAVDDEYEADAPDSNAFPSFGEYLAGLFNGFWIRVRGVGSPHSAETMEADEEDLGPEVRPAAASHYYGTFVQSLRLRFRIALIVWLVLAYISLGLPATGMLRNMEVASGMCLALQLGIMLLGLDIISNAAVNLLRGRFGADTLAVLGCILTSVDAIAVFVNGFGSPHIPLCLLSSFSLLGVLFSSLLSARGLRKSLRVPAIGKRAYSVTAETELTDKTITLIKSTRPVKGFVRRSEEAAPDETAYSRAAPLLLILAFVMSLVIVLVKKSPGDFLFVLTATLAPAVPVTALLCYALPFFVGSERIFSSGAAIAGWSGLCDIGSSHNLIVTDRDLFPEHSVDIDTIRIFADMPSDKIIAYAGSMISASGSGLAPCFAELMERNGCSMCQIEDFELLAGGGMKGNIEGQSVLCGGTELMRLMNVRIPYRLVGKTSVLLALDGVLYGIFNMKYEPNPTVRRALIGLIRSNRHPVFAIRDFNVNPEMLHETFDVATDGYDFPPYLERFTISEAQPTEERKIAAVLCREGLGPLVHMADTGRNMYIIIRINLMISLLASVIGVLAVFFQLLTAGTISMAALFLYAIFWILPVTIVSLFVRI